MKNFKKILLIAILLLFTISIYSQTEKESNDLAVKELKNKIEQEFYAKWEQIESNPKLSEHTKEKLIDKSAQELRDQLNKLKPKSELPLKELKKLAQKNDPEAQKKLAQNYYSHFDFKNAFKWFFKAAENNNTESQYELAMMYYFGYVIKKDIESGFHYLEKAAKGGFAKAQFEYGIMYPYNRDTDLYLKEAAEKNHIGAQTILGLKLKDEDTNTAFYWLEKAASNNGESYPIDIEVSIRKAQQGLGEMYFKGIGTTIDIEKAIYWYTKSIKSIDQELTGKFKEDINRIITSKLGKNKDQILNDQSLLDRLYIAQTEFSIINYFSIIRLGDIYFSISNFDKAIYWYGIRVDDGGSQTKKREVEKVKKEIALRKEEKNAISQGTEVANALYKKRQEEQNEKDRLEKQQIKEQEEYTRNLEAMWAANAARNNFSEKDVIPVDRSSFAKDLGKELNKTANTIKKQGAEYQAASRGTTVAEENAKAKRQAEFNETLNKIEADPNSELNQNKRAQEQKNLETKQAQQREIAKANSIKEAKLNQKKQDEERIISEAQKADKEASKKTTSQKDMSFFHLTAQKNTGIDGYTDAERKERAKRQQDKDRREAEEHKKNQQSNDKEYAQKANVPKVKARVRGKNEPANTIAK